MTKRTVLRLIAGSTFLMLTLALRAQSQTPEVPKAPVGFDIEPPRLTTIIVSPGQVAIEPGKKQTFSAKGLDQHGRDIGLGKVTWTATGGTIDRDAVFLAGPDEGTFLVTATDGQITGTSSVTIAKRGSTRPLIKLPPDEELKAISWEGEIPPQKWMNFYTKVLSKFAASKGLKLKLTVKFDLSSEGVISQQKIEETKVALRELGLDDQILLQ